MHKTLFLQRLLLVFTAILIPGITQAKTVEPAPNGLNLPANYKKWQMIGVSHREDNQSLRAILGNYIAIKAARAGKTNPWPEGSILVKLVWKDTKHPKWETAIVPGEFAHSEIMVKNSKKYASTGGWGFARWLGMQEKPYGKDASFAQECFNCHGAAKDEDHVFTVPAKLP